MNLLSSLFPFVRPALHCLDAEKAHGLTIAALRLMPRAAPMATPALRQNLFGLDFPNPLGLAPGFDKNAEVPDAMLGLGFGFVELGTITPRPQAGNPRPRLFRLGEDRAVINRLGFNNDGAEVVMARLAARGKKPGILGINIGANKDSADRIADYVAGIKSFGALAQYLTINISSPNTPGLRGLQARDELLRLLEALGNARAKLQRAPPMLLKIAPDLSDAELDDIIACCGEGRVNGVIISNTTLSRPDLRSQYASESGGLSGAPLFELSTRQLAKFHQRSNGNTPLIGVGGVEDEETAWIKLEAGASLIQLYSALVYQGPALVTRILAGFERKLAGRSLSAIVGSRSAAIASGEKILRERG